MVQIGTREDVATEMPSLQYDKGKKEKKAFAFKTLAPN